MACNAFVGRKGHAKRLTLLGYRAKKITVTPRICRSGNRKVISREEYSLIRKALKRDGDVAATADFQLISFQDMAGDS